MKKMLMMLTAVGCVSCVWAADLVQEAKQVRQQVDEEETKTAAAQEKLRAVNKSIQTQNGVTRSQETILAGKENAAGSAVSDQNGEKVIWDFKLEERKEFFGNNGLPKAISFVADGERNVLQIVSTEGGERAQRWFSTAEMEQMRGKKVTLSVMVKGTDIQGKGKPKFMLMIPRKGNSTMWPEANIGKGSFDWKKAAFSVQMPYDATGCCICLGFQVATGTIQFKDLKVVAAD